MQSILAVVKESFFFFFLVFGAYFSFLLFTLLQRPPSTPLPPSKTNPQTNPCSKQSCMRTGWGLYMISLISHPYLPWNLNTYFPPIDLSFAQGHHVSYTESGQLQRRALAAARSHVSHFQKSFEKNMIGAWDTVGRVLPFIWPTQVWSQASHVVPQHQQE